MSMTAYNAKDCNVTFNGVYITGLGEDMITGSKDEEMFSSSVGAQGDVVVSENNNPLCTNSIVVQRTSPQRQMLIDAAKNGVVAPLWVENKSLGERMGGTKARLKNLPELGHGKEADDITFEAQVFDYDVSAT